MSTQGPVDKTTTSRGVNEAADGLIQAFEAMSAIAGFRAGINPMITVATAFLNVDDPAHREARELLRVWLALDDLAAAVATRRDNS